MQEFNEIPIIFSTPILENNTEGFSDTDDVDNPPYPTFFTVFSAKKNDVTLPLQTLIPTTEHPLNDGISKRDDTLEIDESNATTHQLGLKDKGDQISENMSLREALDLSKFVDFEEQPLTISPVEKITNSVDRAQVTNTEPSLPGAPKSSDIISQVTRHLPTRHLNSALLRGRSEILSGDLKTIEMVKPSPVVISSAGEIQSFTSANQSSPHLPQLGALATENFTALKQEKINLAGFPTPTTGMATAQPTPRLQPTQINQQIGRIEAAPNPIYAASQNFAFSGNAVEKTPQQVQGSSIPETPFTTLIPLESKQRETIELPLSPDINTKQTSQLQQIKTSMQTTHGTSNSQQIAQQLAVNFSKQEDGTTVVRLNPDELGQVRMTLKNIDGVMTLTILAERPETAETMRRNINDLAQEFETLGYEGLDFSFSDESTSPHQETDEEVDEFNIETLQLDQPILETSTTIATSTGRLDIRL